MMKMMMENGRRVVLLQKNVKVKQNLYKTDVLKKLKQVLVVTVVVRAVLIQVLRMKVPKKFKFSVLTAVRHGVNYWMSLMHCWIH